MFSKFFRSNALDKQLAAQRVRLYRMALSWCGNAMLADDLVQTTLNKALIKQEQLKDYSRMEAWLFRILHNSWMEYLRKKQPTVDIDDESLQNEITPEKALTEQQVVDKVRQAIEMLPLIQRQVVTLVDLEECSYTEVAEILDIPLGTVMSRLSRARELLKKRLMGMHSTHAAPNYLRRVK